MKTVSAIILAGGTGIRMGSETPKQFLPLGDKLVIHHSIDLFLEHPMIDEVIVVCSPAHRPLIKQPLKFALPGKRRQDSLFNGLLVASGDFICVHDAARPFVKAEQLTALIKVGREKGAALLALPARGTIKQASNSTIEQTLDRETIWEAQTPQFIARHILEKGFELVGDASVTDDVALAEKAGAKVELVEGSPHNFKLTSPEDYLLAEALYAAL